MKKICGNCNLFVKNYSQCTSGQQIADLAGAYDLPLSHECNIPGEFVLIDAEIAKINAIAQIDSTVARCGSEDVQAAILRLELDISNDEVFLKSIESGHTSFGEASVNSKGEWINKDTTKDTAIAVRKRIAGYRLAITALRQYREPEFVPDYWAWEEPDEANHIESMVDRSYVMIRVDRLRPMYQALRQMKGE